MHGQSHHGNLKIREGLIREVQNICRCSIVVPDKIRIIIKTTPNGRKEDEEAFHDQIATVPDNMTTIDNHMTH